MVNKFLMSSFISFLISIAFSIISIEMFKSFNQDISSSSGIVSCSFTYYVSISSIQNHFFPGLIFDGICLFVIIVGFILFIIGFFLKRKTNENLLQKETKNNGKIVVLKFSFSIFTIVICLSLIALTNFMIFQDLIPHSIINSLFTGGPTHAITSTILGNHYFLAENILVIYSILIVIGIILFALGIFTGTKVIERQTQEKI